MKLHTFSNDNLRHRLMALQSNTALCDFTFKLHDSSQFSTHKAVVAAFSTTALMLCDETGQVVIPRHDITRDIFQIVLNFIYGQSIVVKDTYMKQLEWLANYLGIEDLSKVLVPFKSLTSNSDVFIEIKEEPIELNDELDVQESTSAMLHNAVFSDTYADDNDIKDEDNEHSAILTKQRQKRHKTPKGKAKTKSSKKRKTDDTSKTKSDNANKELADDKNDDTDIDNEDDINDEMDTGESASNEINDNIENVTTKQEPADSEQVAEPSTSANADQVEDDTKQHCASGLRIAGKRKRMPMTNAERSKRWRQKQNLHNAAEYRQKRQERYKRTYIPHCQLSAKELKATRERDRTFKRQTRKRKRQKLNSSLDSDKAVTCYQCPRFKIKLPNKSKIEHVFK